MTTLHILRSEPDEQVSFLIGLLSPTVYSAIALFREGVDYDQVISALFDHDRVVCWW